MSIDNYPRYFITKSYIPEEARFWMINIGYDPIVTPSYDVTETWGKINCHNPKTHTQRFSTIGDARSTAITLVRYKTVPGYGYNLPKFVEAPVPEYLKEIDNPEVPFVPPVKRTKFTKRLLGILGKTPNA